MATSTSDAAACGSGGTRSSEGVSSVSLPSSGNVECREGEQGLTTSETNKWSGEVHTPSSPSNGRFEKVNESITEAEEQVSSEGVPLFSNKSRTSTFNERESRVPTSSIFCDTEISMVVQAELLPQVRNKK